MEGVLLARVCCLGAVGPPEIHLGADETSWAAVWGKPSAVSQVVKRPPPPRRRRPPAPCEHPGCVFMFFMFPVLQE